MSHYLRVALAPAYLFLCLLLGGASAAGFEANALLQLLAIPIIFWSLLHAPSTPVPTPARQALGILVLIFLVAAVQLVPLPPSIWTSLPERERIAAGYQLLGLPLPWLPLSLAPQKTLWSGLWLLPAAAVLLVMVRTGSFRAKSVAWVIAVTAALSVLLGALQISGGGWYFYRITNYGFTTGFFANANHMATLLVVTIPFLAALYASKRDKGRSMRQSSGMMVILAGALAVVLVGLVINTSLAGIGLAVPATAASIMLILLRKKKLPAWAGLAIAALAVVAVALLFTLPLGNNLTTPEAQVSPESRYTSFRNSGTAAFDYMPVGSGLGTFQKIYALYEPMQQVTRVYVNHVHNDYIEVALETGLLGLAVLAIFLIWWGTRFVAVWRAAEPDHFARAATIASAAILAHSVVDYPLRTAAISAIFAACCALMAQPRSKARTKPAVAGEEKGKHLSAD